MSLYLLITSQYCTVMMCELWLAMILVLTASLSLPDAVRMATRLVCAMRALLLAMAVWKRDAVCEASLYRLCVIALADELPLLLAAEQLPEAMMRVPDVLLLLVFVE